MLIATVIFTIFATLIVACIVGVGVVVYLSRDAFAKTSGREAAQGRTASSPI
jgi:hypothetical protein